MRGFQDLGGPLKLGGGECQGRCCHLQQGFLLLLLPSEAALDEVDLLRVTVTGRWGGGVGGSVTGVPEG